MKNALTSKGAIAARTVRRLIRYNSVTSGLVATVIFSAGFIYFDTSVSYSPPSSETSETTGATAEVVSSILTPDVASLTLKPKVMLSKPTPAISPKRGPGVSFRDCDDGCPEMVVVGAGSFQMGHKKGGQPIHKVTIGAPFAVGAFEVTFQEWDACFNAKGCSNPADSIQDLGRGQRFPVRVTWYDAKEYVKWLSKKTGETYRLLSESEWEYSARGGYSTMYGVGDGDSYYDVINCAYCFSGDNWGMKVSEYGIKIRPVGTFDPNPFGLYNMNGNVQEWVEDCFIRTYEGAPDDGSARTGGKCEQGVMRGGAFDKTVRSATSYIHFPAARNDKHGVRVAMTIRASSLPMKPHGKTTPYKNLNHLRALLTRQERSLQRVSYGAFFDAQYDTEFAKLMDKRLASEKISRQTAQRQGLGYKNPAYWAQYKAGDTLSAIFNGRGPQVQSVAPLFFEYVKQYSTTCGAYLPKNSARVSLATIKTTRNGGGRILGQSRESLGVFAMDPKYVEAFKRVYKDPLGGLKGVASALDALSRFDKEGFGAFSGILVKAVSPRLDINLLFRNEGCRSATLLQLSENMLNALEGRRPIASLAQTGKTVTAVIDPLSPNLFTNFEQGCRAYYDIDNILRTRHFDRNYSKIKIGDAKYCSCVGKGYQGTLAQNKLVKYANDYRKWRKVFDKSQELFRPVVHCIK
jgi:formylglycine-generating enzyme required for sulfatase activity